MQIFFVEDKPCLGVSLKLLHITIAHTFEVVTIPSYFLNISDDGEWLHNCSIDNDGKKKESFEKEIRNIGRYMLVLAIHRSCYSGSGFWTFQEGSTSRLVLVFVKIFKNQKRISIREPAVPVILKTLKNQ